MKWFRRGLLAACLLMLGLLLLIGCIPVPTLWQDQPDGTPRPEHFVGTDPKSPIHLGQTRFEDAFIFLNRKITTRVRSGGLFASSVSEHGSSGRWSMMNWMASGDRRRFAISYSVDAGTLIWPLCFTATKDIRQRWLNLELDSRGIVVATQTTTEPSPSLRSPQPVEWLTIFDEPTRRKLQSEGVFPSDELIRQAQVFREQAEAHRYRPTTTTVP